MGESGTGPKGPGLSLGVWGSAQEVQLCRQEAVVILWSGVLTLSPETDGAKAKNVTGKLVSQQTQRVDVFPTSGLQSLCDHVCV